MYNTTDEIPTDQLHTPIRVSGGGDFDELELMPEREWLDFTIESIVYQYKSFMGKPQYIQDKDGNNILDGDGQPIRGKEFKLTFITDEYTLSNGNGRKAWLQLGASFNGKAKLPTFLKNLDIEIPEDGLTPAEVIDKLEGLNVKLQLANKQSKDKTKTYQNVVFDAVKLQ